ncbi:ATP-binding protein [Nocardioides sp.]|uniref:ATP-binding protein n=1 Tax=Nocardioides sp. TaxID=35761 RepID=UPI00261968D3|nr:ATP-binding protein [Nocardioides sp.]MDI6910198.1 ATP-binding protein [Nocardioides sp.]
MSAARLAITADEELRLVQVMGDIQEAVAAYYAETAARGDIGRDGWGGVFGDQAVAAAMIDRVVHHADVLTLKGASYRLRNRGIDTLPSIRTQDTAD